MLKKILIFLFILLVIITVITVGGLAQSNIISPQIYAIITTIGIPGTIFGLSFIVFQHGLLKTNQEMIQHIAVRTLLSLTLSLTLARTAFSLNYFNIGSSNTIITPIYKTIQDLITNVIPVAGLLPLAVNAILTLILVSATAYFFSKSKLFSKKRNKTNIILGLITGLSTLITLAILVLPPQIQELLLSTALTIMALIVAVLLVIMFTHHKA